MVLLFYPCNIFHHSDNRIAPNNPEKDLTCTNNIRYANHVEVREMQCCIWDPLFCGAMPPQFS